MSINFERFKLKLNNGTDIYPVYAIFSSDIINYLKGNRRTECNCFEITNTSPISDFSISIEEEDIVVKDKQIFVQKSLIFSYTNMSRKKIVIPSENILILQDKDRDNLNSYAKSILTVKKTKPVNSGFLGIHDYNGTGSMGKGSMGTGSMGKGSMGTGSMGTGSMGTGSMGKGDMGTGSMRGGSSKKKGKVHYGIRGGKYIIKKGKKIYF